MKIAYHLEAICNPEPDVTVEKWHLPHGRIAVHGRYVEVYRHVTVDELASLWKGKRSRTRMGSVHWKFPDGSRLIVGGLRIGVGFEDSQCSCLEADGHEKGCRGGGAQGNPVPPSVRERQG